MLRERYDDKEIECKFCHQKVKPVLAQNTFRIFRFPFHGERVSTTREKNIF